METAIEVLITMTVIIVDSEQWIQETQWLKSLTPFALETLIEEAR